MQKNKEKKCCGKCKHCTPVFDFKTLSLKGEPTLGRCPNWTLSKSVILSHDVCDLFDIIDELSGETVDNNAIEKEEELRRKKELAEQMRKEFESNNQVVLPTLPYGKQKAKKGRKTKKC